MRERFVRIAYYVSYLCVLGLAIGGITSYVYADVGVSAWCHCVSSPPNQAASPQTQVLLGLGPPAFYNFFTGSYHACPGALMMATASGGDDIDYQQGGNLPDRDGNCSLFFPVLPICCNSLWPCTPSYSCPGENKNMVCWQTVSNADEKYWWMVFNFIEGFQIDVDSDLQYICFIEAQTTDVLSSGGVYAWRVEALTYPETYSQSKQLNVLPMNPTLSPVSVCAHESLGLTQSDVDSLLKNATEQVFLKDEYGATLIERFYDDTDTSCCKGVTCTSFTTFSDADVMPGKNFYDINDREEYDALLGNWSNPGKKKQVVLVNKVFYHPMLGPVNVDGMATRNGYALQVGGLYLSYGRPERVRAFAHEWGHYKGDLPDEYYCPIDGCGKTPAECECKCSPLGQKERGEHPVLCDCEYFKDKAFVPSVNNNFMSKVGRGVRFNQCPDL